MRNKAKAKYENQFKMVKHEEQIIEKGISNSDVQKINAAKSLISNIKSKAEMELRIMNSKDALYYSQDLEKII